MSRKNHFSSVTLPNDKWMTLFTGSPKRAQAVLMLIEEQVLGQANHEHGPAEATLIEVSEQQVDLVLTCPVRETVLWQASCAYPPPSTINTEVKH